MASAADYFLKIKGIEGESLDAKHPKEIQLESWTWGETNMGFHDAGGGGGAGKVQMQDFGFTMKLNAASSKLMIACATGQHIDEAILTCRKAGGEQNNYLKYTFNELHISSYQTGGSGHEPIPTESISFNFAKIKIEYFIQDEKGATKAAGSAEYDLKKQLAAK
ncbi:MAG: type VI secretion system tube protein Hcp [Pyrinomonadaceae bacterium]